MKDRTSNLESLTSRRNSEMARYLVIEYLKSNRVRNGKDYQALKYAIHLVHTFRHELSKTDSSKKLLVVELFTEKLE